VIASTSPRRRAHDALRRAGGAYFETVEIIEYHHDSKIDAPSGMAMMTAEESRPRRRTGPPIRRPPKCSKGRGGRVRRCPRIGAARPGHGGRKRSCWGQRQTLDIRHDTYDRSSFMPGVLLPVERTGRPPHGRHELLDL
jgi:4-hydroxy-tetrahydrodipicolinate reductase